MADGNPISIEEMKRLFANKQGMDLRSGDIAFRIGQTNEIDEAKVRSLIEELSAMKELRNSFIADRAEIEKILIETNSNAFANGDTAQANRRRLQEVEQDLEVVKSKIDELSEAVSTVKQYNENLQKLKKGQRLQLMCAIADKINAEAEAKRPTYQYSETKSNSYDTSMSGGFMELAGNGAEGQYVTSKEIPVDSNGKSYGYTRMYENTWHKVAYINYWGLITWGKGKGPGAWYEFWRWGDDDEKELEKKIRTVESRLNISLLT